MGNAYGMFRPQPPAGAFIFEIESDQCCTCEPCTGRKWDDNMQKPAHASMSPSEWENFVGSMGKLVRSYRKEARSVLPMIICIFAAIILFHPAFGVLGRAMSFGCRRRLEEHSTRPEGRRGLSTYPMEVAASNTIEKDATYFNWEEYKTACNAGCTYTTTHPPSPPSNSSNTSKAQPDQCSEVMHGPLYVATRYENDGGLEQLEKTLERHDGDQRCLEPCTMCWHDPCYAEVRIGGFDKDIDKTEWFSCCAAECNPEDCCSLDDQRRIARLRSYSYEAEEEHDGKDGEWCEGGGMLGAALGPTAG